ncbi:MAG: phosphatase PAP2 family protein [Bacillota bacterium]|nr:phosphatase PAP2 family protein [Bacillota bacterium]
MKLKTFIIITIVFVVLLGVLGFGSIDYDISRNSINRESIWAEFFNMFGELPFTGGLLVFTAILVGSRNRNRKWSSWIGSIIGYPSMLLFSFLVVVMPFRYYYEFDGGIPGEQFTIIVFLALLLFLSVLISLKKLGQERLRRYRKAAIVLGVLIFAEVILVNVLKIIWARPRMRSIETFDQFRYWWQINGPMNSEEFKSFPSGHTANAFVMLAALSFIPNSLEKKKLYFTLFALVFGGFTAMSRVVLGAHFLSDVAFSGYFVILLYFVLDSLIRKRED